MAWNPENLQRYEERRKPNANHEERRKPNANHEERRKPNANPPSGIASNRRDFLFLMQSFHATLIALARALAANLPMVSRLSAKEQADIRNARRAELEPAAKTEFSARQRVLECARAVVACPKSDMVIASLDAALVHHKAAEDAIAERKRLSEEARKNGDTWEEVLAKLKEKLKGKDRG